MSPVPRALFLAALLFAARGARAQSFADPGTGAGVHLSYSRSPDAVSGFFSGGAQLRLRLTGGIGVEILATYRREEYAVQGEAVLRVIEVPVVGSIQLFLLSSQRIQPYILAGGGYYYVRTTALGTQAANGTVNVNKFGLHAGVGVDARLAPRLGAFADARYVFLDVDTVKALDGNPKPSFWHVTAGLNVYF
jgi:outer membrane protein W